ACRCEGQDEARAQGRRQGNDGSRPEEPGGCPAIDRALAQKLPEVEVRLEKRSAPPSRKPCLGLLDYTQKERRHDEEKRQVKEKVRHPYFPAPMSSKTR